MVATAKLVITHPLQANSPLNTKVPFAFNIQGDSSQDTLVTWSMTLINSCPGTLITFNDGTTQMMGSPICAGEGNLHHLNAGETWATPVAGLTFEAIDLFNMRQNIVLQVWTAPASVDVDDFWGNATVTDSLTIQTDVGGYGATIDRASLVMPTSPQKNNGDKFSLTIKNTGNYPLYALWSIENKAGNPGPVIITGTSYSAGDSVEVGETKIFGGEFLNGGVSYTSGGNICFMDAGPYNLTLRVHVGTEAGPEYALEIIDSADLSFIVADSNLPNIYTIVEFHVLDKNGLEVKSRYPVGSIWVPIGEIWLALWGWATGAFRMFHIGAPWRAAVNNWTQGSHVIADLYTTNADGDAIGFSGETDYSTSVDHKTIVNIPLGDQYTTRVQVRVFDQSGQLMSAMPCTVETRGYSASPLIVNGNTNEWLLPKTDDSHVMRLNTTMTGVPDLGVTAKVTIDKEYTQDVTLGWGWDTYIDFTVGQAQHTCPSGQHWDDAQNQCVLDGGSDLLWPLVAIVGVGAVGVLGYWLLKKR